MPQNANHEITFDITELELVCAEVRARVEILGDDEVRHRVGNLTREEIRTFFSIEPVDGGFRIALTDKCDDMLQKLWRPRSFNKGE